MQPAHVPGYIRIAASVVLCAALVAVCAFWARSYAWSDRVMGPLPRSHMFQAYTWRGTFHLIVSGPAYRLGLWETYSSPVPQVEGRATASERNPGIFGFSLQGSGIWHITTPMWFLALAAAGVLATLWRNHFKRQFSLRTFLIAITLLAAVLGLVAIMRSK